MNEMNPNSTIFAFATPPSAGSRAVLRISGANSFSGLESMTLVSSGGEGGNIHRAVLSLGCIRFYAWIWKFPSPASYTAEDMVEIHLVSSPPLLRLLEQKCMEIGWIPAQPGEFTARAFFNGKISLTQAQAVNQLIDAYNDAQIESAISILSGTFNRWITETYTTLAELTAKIESNIDFSEENIELITMGDLVDELSELEDKIGSLLADVVEKNRIDYLPKVFLAGITNAGKSTLLNKLSGLDRAICSPLPGTTRDVLGAVWKHKNQEVLLCDTAGFLDAPDDDYLTQRAIRHSEMLIGESDLTIILFDAEKNIDRQMQLLADSSAAVNNGRKIIAVNKIDLLPDEEVEQQKRKLTLHYGIEAVTISCLNGAGLEQLTVAAFSMLSDMAVTAASGQITLDLRARNALTDVVCSLRMAREDAQRLNTQESLLGLEVIAGSLRQATEAMGILLGKDVTEDVLGEIFSRFCIGK